MKIIKFFLILLLVITTIGGGLYYASIHLKPDQIPPQLSSLQILQPLVQNGLAMVAQNLPDNTQIGNVLGTKTELTVQKDGSTGAPQRAMEYARYTYCQQVIKDYQARYSSASESAKMILPRPSAVPATSNKY